MTVPVGGVSSLSTVKRVAKRPLLSWAAMQEFSTHTFWGGTRSRRSRGKGRGREEQEGEESGHTAPSMTSLAGGGAYMSVDKDTEAQSSQRLQFLAVVEAAGGQLLPHQVVCQPPAEVRGHLDFTWKQTHTQLSTMCALLHQTHTHMHVPVKASSTGASMVTGSEPVRWLDSPASTNSLVAWETAEPSASSSSTLAEDRGHRCVTLLCYTIVLQHGNVR